MATRSLLVNLVSIALVLMAASAAAKQSEAESLVDVLGTLRRSGVDVLYSTDLITPAMAIAAPLHSKGALAAINKRAMLTSLTMSERVATGRQRSQAHMRGSTPRAYSDQVLFEVVS